MLFLSARLRGRVCMLVITQLGHGKYSDCFVVQGAGGQAVALKVSYYQEATIRAFARLAQHGDRGAAHEAKDQDAISVSMAMAEVARQMRVHAVSPHFVRVYCEADIRNLPLRLRALLRDRLARLTPRQIKYSHVCLMQLYTCNMTSLLRRRCTPTDPLVRALIFQVVYTLACLQQLFPAFRHNDLSTNNVLVKPARHRCVRYDVGGATFFVAGVGYTAALADFDFTHVPGHAVLSNERVLGGKYGITGTPNPSYDCHLFLATLHKALRANPGSQCPQTAAFIHSLRLDPGSDRCDAAVPHLAPHALLAHAYFTPLRARPSSPSLVDAHYSLPV